MMYYVDSEALERAAGAVADALRTVAPLGEPTLRVVSSRRAAAYDEKATLRLAILGLLTGLSGGAVMSSEYKMLVPQGDVLYSLGPAGISHQPLDAGLSTTGTRAEAEAELAQRRNAAS